MQEHLPNYLNNMEYNSFLKQIPTGGGLSKCFHFLSIVLRVMSEQPHIDLNEEYGFNCLWCILGQWSDKYRLWTINLDTVNNNIFFLFSYYSFYYIVWRCLWRSSFQVDLQPEIFCNFNQLQHGVAFLKPLKTSENLL